MSEVQNNTIGMWDEPIVELKVGGINGISFRKNQSFSGKNSESPIIVTNIVRSIDDVDAEVFLVFAKKGDEGEEKLLKISKGEPVYATFDVFED